MTNLDYLYDKDAAQDKFGKEYFSDKSLNFRIIERGTILPHKHLYVNGKWTWGFGGLSDKKGKFVEGSFVHHGAGAVYTPVEKVQYIPATVIYLDIFCTAWGHNIADNVRRLWFFKSDVFKSYFKNCPTFYLPWGRAFTFDQQKNFKRLLEILEINTDKIYPLYQPVQFENVILPDESYFFGSKTERTYFTKEYQEVFDRVRSFALKNRTPTDIDKLYFFYGQHQFGEERLAEYFKSKGYEVVSPEKLTLDEQLNLLINAESFASTLGSCSHNSVFMRDDAELILIPRAAKKFTTGRQDLFNQMRKANAFYVDSSLSVFEAVNDAYCFIVSRQLKEFFGDKFDGYSEDEFETFLMYVKNSTSRGLKLNQKTLPYYASILQGFLNQFRQHKDLLTTCGINLTQTVT